MTREEIESAVREYDELYATNPEFRVAADAAAQAIAIQVDADILMSMLNPRTDWPGSKDIAAMLGKNNEKG